MCFSKALTFARTLAVASISPLAARMMLSFSATLFSIVGEVVDGTGESSPRCDAGLGVVKRARIISENTRGIRMDFQELLMIISSTVVPALQKDSTRPDFLWVKKSV